MSPSRLHVAAVVCHIVCFAVAPGDGQEQQARGNLAGDRPAGGKCVRLRQGDYRRETVFGDDPAAMARHWVDLGAQCLHLVDLDGAREGRPVNLASVRAIVEAVGVPCELGGGIRNEETIRELLDLGLAAAGDRHAGAAASPTGSAGCAGSFPAGWCWGSTPATAAWPPTAGWQTSDVAAIELARQFAGEPIAAMVYTDIATDGMMAGPNVAAMAAMQAAVDVPVVASGGVTTRGGRRPAGGRADGRLHHRPGVVRRNVDLARGAGRGRCA